MSLSFLAAVAEAWADCQPQGTRNRATVVFLRVKVGFEPLSVIYIEIGNHQSFLVFLQLFRDDLTIEMNDARATSSCRILRIAFLRPRQPHPMSGKNGARMEKKAGPLNGVRNQKLELGWRAE